VATTFQILEIFKKRMQRRNQLVKILEPAPDDPSFFVTEFCECLTTQDPPTGRFGVRSGFTWRQQLQCVDRV
jgi:hypothetical protein